ncbi:hypothetical protein BHOIPH791_11400 [Bartonella henselae]|nr:hypothetical protein BH623125_02190 [Bartonella henselae]GFF04190.1 hypothetical protein BH80429_10110 [Bartonella henselae]
MGPKWTMTGLRKDGKAMAGQEKSFMSKHFTFMRLYDGQE